MKKNIKNKKTHLVKKIKKPKVKKSLMIELSNGSKIEYFKLPYLTQLNLKNEIPAIAELLKEF